MIIEFIVKVPYGTKDDIEEAIEKWKKIISKITLFKIREKRIIHQIVDEPNNRFIWHIKLKDKGLFVRSKDKQLKLINSVIITANMMANEGLKNKLAKNHIKKKVGYTLHSYCARTGIMFNQLSEQEITRLTEKLDTEYDEIYQNIINDSGATINNSVDDDKYDYETNTFMEVL